STRRGARLYETPARYFGRADQERRFFFVRAADPTQRVLSFRQAAEHDLFAPPTDRALLCFTRVVFFSEREPKRLEHETLGEQRAIERHVAQILGAVPNHDFFVAVGEHHTVVRDAHARRTIVHRQRVHALRTTVDLTEPQHLRHTALLRLHQEAGELLTFDARNFCVGPHHRRTFEAIGDQQARLRSCNGDA